MRKIVFIGILLSVAHVCFSQHHNYTIRNYKAIDGLPQSQVNVMLEDKNGYLWIGTEGGGLARFDGREFKVYTTLDGLLSNIVSSLTLDRHENLWIVHPRGITKFNGIQFKTFEQPGSASNAKWIRRAFEIKDSLFFISAPGFLGKIYDDSAYYWSKPFKSDILIGYSHLTPENEILLYLSDSTFVTKPNNSLPFGYNNKFKKIFNLFNYKNDVCIKTDSGYFTVDVKKGSYNKVQLGIKHFILFYDSINDVFYTRNGDLLLKEKLTDDGIDIDTILQDVSVRQVLVDSENNTWFASDGEGLFKYFVQDFDKCSSKNITGVSAVFKDSDGAKWIGTRNRGLWKIKKGKVSSFIDKHNDHRNAIWSITESPEGQIWVATTAGLGKYNKQENKFTWLTTTHGLSNATIFALDIDERGGLWIGTNSGGVNYLYNNRFTTYTIKQGLSTNTVNCIYYSQRYKKLFIGNEFGVNSIGNGTVENLQLRGLDNTSILSINSYRDSLLLIGSGGAGIAIYNPATKSNTVITTHHGLISDFVYFVVSDENDNLWIGTEKGITQLKLNNELEITNNLHYDYENGLTGVETNQNAFYISPNEKYFGLIDGLYKYNNFQNDHKLYDLHLTDIQIQYGQYSARDYADNLVGFFKIPQNLQLPPDKNHITFSFNRVDKRYPKSIKFRYLLQNFDKTWSQPSWNNRVTYSNLPPGDYVLHVQSTDNRGRWDANPLTYAFTIKAPFYQTASFIVGSIIFLGGLITLALYLRVKQRVNKVMMLERIRAKEQETLRKEIARDFHDEMGNQLTRIINYVSLLKLNGLENGVDVHNDLYTKVEDSAKYLYTGTRDFIWSIDPGNDELSKLFIHIRDFGEKLFEEKSIQFRAFNEVKEKVKLPYGFSREANLIFKEAMTNAFKYSNAANVALYLRRTDSEFEMIFEDDGIGFYTGDIPKLNGLKNIRERANRINAVLRIQSERNKGTRIILGFKLNKTLKYGLAL
ncbi:ligand-binding sensor domain-containing protein [Chryseosolibacter indicus]|uniref:Two component regulator three Y domain-containing protein n=1 Tax=Chryseosolibacter indicus TaxID=2782351 RepID=A0ABS5VRB8_9BACT|nr:sensor histidine kinase [Chryseosolibacter indicus]MBT1703995.1 hypothetical protein [Chryseosolibacter indicus]